MVERLLLLTVVSGCAPDSDYLLAIDPITPPNLAMSGISPDVTLVHRAGATASLFPLGALASAEFTDLPPLADGTIGLLLSDEGTASETYDPGTLVGYGEAPLGGPLASGGEERRVSMLLTEFAGAGDLGEAPRRDAPLQGAVALTPSGAAYLFGGQREGEPHDTIQRVPDIRGGDWRLESVGSMPEIGNASGVSVLHTATALDDGRVLVTGGRPEYFAISDNRSNVFVFDTATDEVVWQASNGMNPSRSRHQAVKLRSGRVLLFGGWQGAGVDAELGTFQIFDPDDLRFTGSGTAAANPLGANLTEAGGDGAIVCGGYRFDFGLNRLIATTACERISLNGDLIPFPDLPEPVGMGAMAALPDGRILLAGGVVGDIDIPFEDGFLVGANVGNATDRAWLYEPSSGAWREVGRMGEARAGAVAMPSGDGRFIVLGGAQKAGVMIAEDEGPVFCPEVFDPATAAFSSGGSCSTPSSGAFPPVSVQAGIGAFVVQGHIAVGGDETGGQAYGIVGLAPTGL
ncbi:MAG: hypothetical protein R3F61_28330 [Myxococcota bacterium]